MEPDPQSYSTDSRQIIFPRFSLLPPCRLNKFTTTLLRDITELPEWKYYGIGDTLSSTTLLYEKCHRYQSDFSCSRL